MTTKYIRYQSVDPAHGIVADVAVTPGNVNDSTSYLERIEYMKNHRGLNIKAAGADSAYGTSLKSRTVRVNIFEEAETHCLLSAMALNLKRMVKCLD